MDTRQAYQLLIQDLKKQLDSEMPLAKEADDTLVAKGLLSNPSEAAHLFIEGHVRDSGKTKIVLAIGTHLHESQYKETMWRVMERVLEHGKVGTATIANWRSKSQHRSAAIDKTNHHVIGLAKGIGIGTIADQTQTRVVDLLRTTVNGAARSPSYKGQGVGTHGRGAGDTRLRRKLCPKGHRHQSHYQSESYMFHTRQLLTRDTRTRGKRFLSPSKGRLASRV